MDCRGLIFTAFDVERNVAEDIRPWHSDEHISERLPVPGVLGAARYVSESEPLHCCALYFLDSPEVFNSAPYQSLFAAPSALTQRIIAGVSGVRFIGDVVRQTGSGHGGCLARWRFVMAPDDDTMLLDWFDNAALEARGLATMRLMRPRRDMPAVTDPHWILLIEGYDRSAVTSLDDKLVAGPGDASHHLFRLEHLLTNPSR
jgi:hypothetical protein